MRLFRQILFACIALITLASYSNASSVSGIYVQKFKNAVVFIQIVVTPDGKVAGRGESVFVLADGKLKKRSFPLEGSIDGNQISLKSNEIFGLGQALSGTVDGETLRLTSDNGQMNLVKSDLDTFAQEKSKLAASGAAIVSANQEAKFQAEAKDYLDKLSSDGKNLEIKISKLSQVESKGENFLMQIRQRRNLIVAQIESLRTKIPLVSAYDGGVMEANIGALMADLGALRSQFDADIYKLAAVYDELQTSLKSFKSSCDKWVSKYSPTLPSECNNYQSHLATYQSSRANMRYKFNEAGKMFAFN